MKWDCKYHVVIVPKYRQRVFFGRRRKQIGEILRELCRQKEIGLLKGNAQPDHVHMLLSIPPKYSVAMTLGFLKGKKRGANPSRVDEDARHLVWTEFLVSRLLCEHGGIR